jgi:RNA polymerase sigma-70 factor (ECF subfamily)
VKAPAAYAHLSNTVTTALEAAPARELPACALDVEAVHAEHADFVWRSLQRLGVRDADLEDMLQEVFVVVHRRLHTLEAKERIVSWLFGIATRVAAAYRRRSYVRREQPEERVAEDEPIGDDDGPEALASTHQARARLEAILDELDVEKRAVFVMFEIDELDCDEIAVIVGVPIGTVYSRLHAARKAFEKGVARLKARGEHAARAARQAHAHQGDPR